MTLFVGIDFGTSGARLMAIDAAESILFERSIPFSSNAEAVDPMIWRKTLFKLLEAIPQALKRSVERIAIDGTSSTILLCDGEGDPLLPPRMYCDRGRPEVLEKLKTIVPPEHIVLSLSSSLCKYLSWADQPSFKQARYLLHQADWLAAQLHGQLGLSDYHNSLKLGFDPETLSYPVWFDPILERAKLPQPLQPGQMVGQISAAVAAQLGLSRRLEIVSGTTDSIAAFLASGAQKMGDAVTSLGSTIALKLLSNKRVDALTYGVYSHWCGNNWLVGGASNAGGAILAKFFSQAELVTLSSQIDWSMPVPTYVPLLKVGERFPINAPNLAPCLEPRPDNPVLFLQALLVSLTRVEQEGYQRLQMLGASSLKRLFTCGGGASNLDWTVWRSQQMGVSISQARCTEAAFGTARLALGCFL